MMPEVELDAFDPQLECGAWTKAARVIGGPSHTHVCRAYKLHGDEHPGTAHVCTCGFEW